MKINESLQKQLQDVQAQLRENYVGVSIVKRGKRLYLRATLPPKLGSEKKTGISSTLA